MKELRIFYDELCTKELSKVSVNALGKQEIGTSREIPFFVKNTGTTSLIDIGLENTLDDSEVIVSFPPVLKSRQTVAGILRWNPKFGSKEGVVSGKFHITAKSIGEE